jgi:uncharacterized protein YndB with AHSA1/START domain
LAHSFHKEENYLMQQNTADLVVTTPGDLEIVMERTFDAPAQLIFDCWTKPEHIVNWFGGPRTKITTCEVDLRPGGAWKYVMEAVHVDGLADWGSMTMFGTFREMSPPSLLVYTEAFAEFPDGGQAVVTMTIEERDGKTHWRSTSVYGSKETRDAVVASGMEEGARETIDALEALLKQLQA